MIRIRFLEEFLGSPGTTLEKRGEEIWRDYRFEKTARLIAFR